MTARQERHGIARYRKKNCRCEVCVAANKEYQQRRRKYQDEPVFIDAEPLIKFFIRIEEPMTGAMRKRITRWRRKGVDIYNVDKMCVSRGYHPFEIYGDLWWKIGNSCEVD